MLFPYCRFHRVTCNYLKVIIASVALMNSRQMGNNENMKKRKRKNKLKHHQVMMAFSCSSGEKINYLNRSRCHTTITGRLGMRMCMTKSCYVAICHFYFSTLLKQIRYRPAILLPLCCFEKCRRYSARRTREFLDILMKVGTNGNIVDGDLHMNMESGNANWSCHHLTVVIGDRAVLSDVDISLDNSELS